MFRSAPFSTRTLHNKSKSTFSIHRGSVTKWWGQLHSRLILCPISQSKFPAKLDSTVSWYVEVGAIFN
jgi:hypothetical protein